jgi:hypothetical protein
MRPNLEKGTDRVVMLGVTFLITITSSGSFGTSFDACFEAIVEKDAG